MNTTVIIILTACAVLVVLLLAILTFKVLTVLSETEFLLREARNEASPALQKLNRILKDIEVVSNQINEQSTNVHELLSGFQDDLNDIRMDWKRVSKSWSRQLTPGSDGGSISTIAQIVLEMVKAYFSFRDDGSKTTKPDTKEE